MFRMNKRGKTITGAMIIAMLLAQPTASVFAAKLPGAGYSPVQLEAVQTKEMTYYKTGSASIPGTIEWTTDSEALQFLPLSVIGDVTSVVKDEPDAEQPHR